VVKRSLSLEVPSLARNIWAGPNVWMHKSRKSDNSEYYEYTLLYVDDCLAISECPKNAVLQLDKYFKMQLDLIAPPDIYLDRKVKKIRLPNMVEAWTFISSPSAQEVSQMLGYISMTLTAL